MGIPLCTITLLFLWIQIVHRLPVPPLVISEETTRITGPLTDEGYIDFLQAAEQRFYPPELATDDNGYRLFVRQFGYIQEHTEDEELYRRQTYEKLALDPEEPPTLVLPQNPYQILEDFYQAKGEQTPEHMKEPWEQPWTLEEFPMFADWCEDIDAPLDAIAEALRKPVFYTPLLQSPESVQSGLPQMLIATMVVATLDDYILFQGISVHFRVRAMYRIAQGDIDGAIEDKLSIRRLGRHFASGKLTMNYLVGMALESSAMDIPVGANRNHPLTAEQIRRIFEGLDALPPRTPMYDVVELERYMGLSTLQWLIIGSSATRNQELSDEDFGMMRVLLSIATSRHCDLNFMFRRVNEMYDALQEPPKREKLRPILERLESRYTTERQVWQGLIWGTLIPYGFQHALTDAFIAVLAPATLREVEKTEARLAKLECADNMQRLVWAVLLYRLEHGTMPDENWATQIKKYLGENPEQYFSCPGNPSPEGKTTYALVQYSEDVPETLDTILLVELKEPVPFAQAVISSDEILTLRIDVHDGGVNTVRRSGAVWQLSEHTDEKELARLLGRAVAE